jgi:hypothetical protein
VLLALRLSTVASAVIVVPTGLVGIDVTAGSAADYDRLLGGAS